MWRVLEFWGIFVILKIKGKYNWCENYKRSILKNSIKVLLPWDQIGNVLSEPAGCKSALVSCHFLQGEADISVSLLDIYKSWLKWVRLRFFANLTWWLDVFSTVTCPQLVVFIPGRTSKKKKQKKSAKRSSPGEKGTTPAKGVNFCFYVLTFEIKLLAYAQ